MLQNQESTQDTSKKNQEFKQKSGHCKMYADTTVQYEIYIKVEQE
jgi:hypothetical protein